MTKIAYANGYADQLNAESLRALIENEILAIRIPNFMTEIERSLALKNIRYYTEKSTYLWSRDFSVIGTSVGEAHENKEKEDEYFSNAQEVNRLLQSIVFPFGSPMARVAKQILDAWSPGIKIASKDGRPFLAEIVRHFRRGGKANPHIDQTKTPLLGHLGLKKRLGCNVYIEMPTEGGSIQFWNRRFSDVEYEAVKTKGGDYGVDRELLGEPSLSIRPRAPEVVLFDASLPHAVEEIRGEGDRIVNGGFFAFADYDSPLVQFS